MEFRHNEEKETLSVILAVRRITWISVVTNLLLVALKFIAGFLGHSSVLVADAIHSLSDLITDAAILFGVRFWSRPADREHPYGHAKMESLVTLFIGAVLTVIGLELLYDAVISLIGILNNTVERVQPTWLPLVAALTSIVVKEGLYRMTLKVGIAAKSPATVANAWHHRSDALSSVPAAAAVGACLFLGPQYVFLDPVGTVVVAFMIVHIAWEISLPAFTALLDRGASELQCQTITETIRSFTEVKDLHRLRTRHIGTSGIALDVHIQVDPDMSITDAHKLSHAIQQKLLQSSENIIDTLVYAEPYPSNCPFNAGADG